MERNDSGLRPVGRAVLVAPYTPERKESIIIMTSTSEEQSLVIEQRAIVVELGPHVWCNEPSPRAKVGDKVLISKFAGYMAKGTKDGKQYRFVNDNDIFAVIEAEEQENG